MKKIECGEYKQGNYKNKLNRFIASSIGFLLSMFCVYGTDAYFESFSMEKGLPSNYINCVALDSLGFVWAGTEKGPVFFDGYTFKSLNTENDSLNKAHLIDMSVLDILADNNFNIWYGTSQGLVKYNQKTANYTVFKSDKSENCLANNYSRALELDANNNVWVGQWTGLSKIDGQTGKITNYFTPAFEGDIFATCITSILPETDKGIIWCGTWSGYLYKFDLATLTFIPFTQIVNKQNTPEIGLISDLYRSDDGRLIASSWIKGCQVINEETLSFHPIPEISKFDRTHKIIDFRGSLWIGSEQGAFAMSKKQTYKEFLPDENIEGSLSCARVFDFVVDKQGGLWLAGDGSLEYYHSESKKFGKVTRNLYDKFSLPSNKVNSVFEYPEGFIWFSTEKGTLIYHFGEKRQVSMQELGINLPSDLKFFDFYLLNKKTALFTTRTSIIEYNIEAKTFIETKVLENEAANEFLYSILKISNSEVLLICQSASSPCVGKYNIVNHSFTKIDNPAHKEKTTKWYTNQISMLNDTVWIIGQTVAFKRTHNNNQFDIYSFDIKDSTRCGLHLINEILSTQPDMIWMATLNNGLAKFFYRECRVEYITKNDGLLSDGLYSLCQSKNGKLWIGTDKGLNMMDINTNQIFAFNKDDGLLTNYLARRNSFFQAADETIFLITSNGVNYFNPNAITINSVEPEVFITSFDFLNDDKLQSVYTDTSLIFKKQFRLKFSENNIKIGFTAQNYLHPQKNEFQYQLKGLESIWNKTTANNRVASYSNLPPGKYEFILKASNNDGVWNTIGTSIFIEITPPWWATWWFRIGLFLFVAGSAIGYYRYRLNTLKREKRILEEKVAERTSELSEANAQLEERQEEILAQKEELETKNEEIGKAYDNMQLLSDFGQRITATLNLDAINQMIYEYVSSLMDTQAFGIGIYNEKRKVIEFLHFVEDGKVLPYFTKDLSASNSLSVRCFANKEEIVIGNLSEEYKRYLASLPEVQTKQMPVSMVHLPLVVEGRAIGTITVNSFRQDAYGSNELNNLRSLASYISIALDNASVYKVLRFTNEKVRSSIEYARTIQQAILPLREEMDKHFQSFVLFRPKDVVSGDFYWMQIVDEAIYFAVVDCTGHGVPGAFMSLIGSRLLDEIVKEKGIRQPAQILETLDRELGIALRQGETENNDGMDVCLVKLEKGKVWTITFSGAMRPLYIMQNEALTQLKGDRRSIGGKRTARKTSIAFTDQSMEITSGTTLYLSSDGYTDQNNNRQDKFGILPFEKLLTTIAQQPLEEQLTRLNNALDTHMRNDEQRDDITVVGVRFT